MASESDASLAKLKQLLVTGSNNVAWNGSHLVRHLVDWFLRNEREHHSKLNLPESPPGEDGSKPRLRATNPGDTLINCTSIIPKLVEEGKAEVIIDTLRAYSQLPYVDKEALVLCLAVASKQSDQKKLVTDAHSAVRELCTNTHLFFLFIQISKMISKQAGHSGWGRGLRRAVNQWYLRWEPKHLALEVTRHFSAYGWTHRDVIRLAHLKLKELPLGTQVVLHYVFMGLEKTVQEYTDKDNTSELLELLHVLDKDSNPKEGESSGNMDQVINKVNKLHEMYGCLTLDDVSSQSLKSPEVWSHILDKLDGESAVASVNRMAKASLLNPSCDATHGLPSKLVDCLTRSSVTSGSVTPTQALMALHAYEHPTRYIGDTSCKFYERKPSRGGASKSPKLPLKTLCKKNTKVNPQVVDALHSVITASAKNVEKTSRKLGICVDVRGSMSTSHVWTGNPEGKGEVTGHEGAAVTVLTLTSGGTSPAATTLAFTENTLAEIKLSEGITLLQLINTFKETVIGEVNIDAALKWAKENAAETIVVLTHKFEQHAIYGAAQSLQQFNETSNTHIRLVLCGLGTKHVHPQQTDNFLLVLGFDQRTPNIIRAFHERHF
ncbi:RNA-binding protein RO60 [Procambarus clarkii]|uniref:RNA-binding protein RO60 n=1 Tax=Procambarus clarkii TaxID=6728 RepID=UPI001E673439|nr:60 kDa SS-A/Ro ribonucleoprotein-like [Procambarus clarkii]XP_045617501.1 60 kDa SS-A/Ro ribonucleoprotein-like [Procambarus clarkii]XP_045617502.1 60 kDa SS-A/Ro ribonucleoprotein-like [Procambarus clarkii]